MKKRPEEQELVIAQAYDLRAVWKTYAYWAFWVGVAFFIVYPLCNWISAQRSEVYQLYLQTELSIPLIPEFLWAYLSMYVLFLLPPLFLSVTELVLLGKRIILGTIISGVIFLLLPSQLGFDRVIPEGFYGGFFSQIFTLDLPYNMAPSLHIVYSGLILLAVYNASKAKSVRILSIVWLTLIALSTLFVHQHHVLDILSAMLIIGIINKKIIKGERNV